MKITELSEAEIEELWLDEAERREQEWDAGEVEGIPAEEVLRELRSSKGFQGHQGHQGHQRKRI